MYITIQYDNYSAISGSAQADLTGPYRNHIVAIRGPIRMSIRRLRRSTECLAIFLYSDLAIS
jgi:hypothetical protein